MTRNHADYFQVLLQRHCETIPALTPEDAERSQRIAVIGAGLMGVAIAATHLRNPQMSVLLVDASEDVAASAASRTVDELAMQLALHIEDIGADQSDASMFRAEAEQIVAERLAVAQNMAGAEPCDLIIETVPETPNLKQMVYATLAEQVRHGALLTSNTSTIPITQLATTLEEPDRFAGFHFFHPVRERSLVEIIRGEQTSEATIQHLCTHALTIGQTPIVVNDGPGFLVNRLLHPYLSEAVEMLIEGTDIEAIDAAATSAGMAMGPFRIMDEIGLDVVMHGGRTLFEAFPERVPLNPLLARMIKKKRLGRKVGQGFYRYDSETSWAGTGQLDPELEPIVARYRADSPVQWAEQDIAQRLLYSMLLEGMRVIEDGIVDSPEMIDLAVVLGLGFPVKLGGLFHWGRAEGPERIREWMERMRPSLGERAKEPEVFGGLMGG